MAQKQRFGVLTRVFVRPAEPAVGGRNFGSPAEVLAEHLLSGSVCQMLMDIFAKKACLALERTLR